MSRQSRSEKAIQNDVLVKVTALPDTFCWRNNTGEAWQGRRARFYPGTEIPVPAGVVVLVDARPVSFGLKGSADIIGATAGRPLAIEVKDENGRQEEDQKRFQAAWEKVGGLYLLVRDPDDAAARVAEAHPMNVLG